MFIQEREGKNAKDKKSGSTICFYYSASMGVGICFYKNRADLLYRRSDRRSSLCDRLSIIYSNRNFLQNWISGKKDFPKFLLAGVLGFALYMITFNQASKSLTAATGSVVIASAPILTALFARIIFKEKIRPLGWLAIAVEFSGILVLTLWSGILSVNAGILWMFGAAVCISSYNLLQRSLLKKYSPLQATAYSVFAGTLFLLVYLPDAAIQFGNAPLYQLLVMGFMGVFPSALAYMLWAKALTMAQKISDVTNYMFVTPLLAALMGFLIMGEIPTLATCVGGLMIFTGLLLFKKSNA